MEYVNLGRTGLKVSRLCLGCMTYGEPDRGTHPWTLGEEQSRPFLQRAVELGINFFDTANVYSAGSSEEIVGRALRDFAKRDEVVIATKVHGPMRKEPNGRGLSRKAIMTEIDASLRRLGTDYVDLYQIHRWDYSTPIEETLEALDTLVRSGDVRYVGLSNWAAWQIMKAIGIARSRHLAPITSLQAYYTLVGRDIEREIAPLLRSEGVGLMVWSPLAGGYLTGKYSGGRSGDGGRQTELDFPPIDRARGEPLIEVLQSIAEKHGHQPAQIAIAWLLRQPVVSTVIIGAKRVEQLRENVRSTQIALDDDDMVELDAVSRLPGKRRLMAAATAGCPPRSG